MKSVVVEVYFRSQEGEGTGGRFQTTHARFVNRLLSSGSIAAHR